MVAWSTSLVFFFPLLSNLYETDNSEDRVRPYILQLTRQLLEPYHCYCDSLRFLYFVRSIPKPDKHLTIETLFNQYKIKWSVAKNLNSCSLDWTVSKSLHLDQINLSCSPENLKFAWSLYLVISVKKHNIILNKILKKEKRKSFL